MTALHRVQQKYESAWSLDEEREEKRKGGLTRVGLSCRTERKEGELRDERRRGWKERKTTDEKLLAVVDELVDEVVVDLSSGVSVSERDALDLLPSLSALLLPSTPSPPPLHL